MAGFGIGIGSFMEGLTGGMRVRQGMDDRAYARTRQERQDQLDLEDRQRRISREDESRKLLLEDRETARQDRARRQKLEDEDREFGRQQRGRQQQQWKEEDETKQTFQQAGTDAERMRAEDVKNGVTPIEAQGPTEDGKSLPAWKVGGQTFVDEKQAQAASDHATKPVMDYFMTKTAPNVVSGLMKQGKVKEAQAFQAWIKDEQVQRGMKSWAAGLQAASRGDAEGFAKHMLDAYNNQGYVADGSTAAGNVIRDKDGNIDGIEFTVTDRNGHQTKQVLRGMEDVYRMGTQFMAPEAVFQQGMQQLANAEKQRSEIAREKRMHQYQMERDTNSSLLRQAEEAAKKQGPAAYEAFQKRINSAMSTLMANDPSFSRLSDDEKAERALKYIQAQDKVTQSAAPQASNPAGGRSIPVWRSQPPADQ